MRMPTRRATFWSASVLTAATVGLALPIPAASAADTSSAVALTAPAGIPSPVGEPIKETFDLLGGLTHPGPGH